MLAKLRAQEIQAFSRYKSADGSEGVTALTAGIQFKNGLYVGGTFSAAALPITTNNITINGTAGNGYIQYAAQTAAPALALVHTFADAGGHFAIGQSGSSGKTIAFTNGFLTADRDYAFQNKSGTLAMTGDNVSTFVNDSGYLVSSALANYVQGPASSGNNRLASFNGTTGKLIQDSGIFIAGTTGKTLTLTGGLTIGADASITGGGTLALAGFTLTVPATGTAVLTSRTITEGNGLAGNTYDLSANRTLALGTPSTNSVSSTNAVTATSHTHAITSSANPGAAASILASDSSGFLRLVRLGIGTAPTQPLHVAGNAFIDAATANLYMKDTSTGLQASTSGIVTLQSGNALRNGPGFTSGLSGWNESYNGDVEFNNGRFRGEFAASVFKVSEISATAGTFGVFYSAAALYADCTTGSALFPTAGNLFDMSAKNSDAGGMLFAVNDIIRLKSWTGAGISDSWGVIQVRTNNGSYTTYAVALVSGSTSATFRAGTAVVDYGPSGTGFITLSTDGTIGSSPNLTMATHAGSPWSAFTTLLRLGNLNGSYGYAANTYGIGVGSGGASDPYFIATAGSVRFGRGSTDYITFSGTDAQFTNLIKMSGASAAISLGTTPPASASVGTGVWIDRSGIYSLLSDTQNATLTSAGFTSGGGNVILDSAGLTINAGAASTLGEVRWVTSPGVSQVKTAYLVNQVTSTNSNTELRSLASSTGSTGLTSLLLTAENDGGFHATIKSTSYGSSHATLAGQTHLNLYGAVGFQGVAIGSTAVPTHMLDVYGTGWFQGALSSDSTVSGTNIKATAIVARAYNSANISISNATITTITLDSERWDTDTIHSTSSNTGRLTCKTAGKYVIAGTFEFAANSTGSRIAYIYLNGATIIARDVRTAVTTGSFETGFTITAIYDLAVNDYVEMKCYQDSGSALNVKNNPNFSPEFSMVWMGP